MSRNDVSSGVEVDGKTVTSGMKETVIAPDFEALSRDLNQEEKLWKPLNADLYEMKLTVNVKESSNVNYMANRIGVLQNINIARQAGH